MPLDPDFVADCPYAPGALLIDDVLEIDRERSLVRCNMPTHDDLPITRDQRVHPLKHPRHVSGGLMVHMTGVVGLVHAYHVLDLRHRDGWIGYGVRIHSAKFAALAPPGDPLVLEGRMTQGRRGSKRILARYELVFTQRGKTVYQGEQSAMWIRVEEGEALAL